jgi:hypothetical protein
MLKTFWKDFILTADQSEKTSHRYDLQWVSCGLWLSLVLCSPSPGEPRSQAKLWSNETWRIVICRDTMWRLWYAVTWQTVRCQWGAMTWRDVTWRDLLWCSVTWPDLLGCDMIWHRADFVWLWKTYGTDRAVPWPWWCRVLAFWLDEKRSHAMWLVEEISSMPFSHSYQICSTVMYRDASWFTVMWRDMT